MALRLVPIFPINHPITGEDPIAAWGYPGQAAQKKGMGANLYRESPAYRRVLDEANAVVQDRFEIDLVTVIHEDPEDQLKKTEVTQPALVATSLAFQAHLEHEEGIKPGPNDVVLGHSLGYVSALGATRALTLQEAVLVAGWRGLLFKDVFDSDPRFKEGPSMAVLFSLTTEEVIAICAEAQQSIQGSKVVLANDNSLVQKVISGHPAAVAKAKELARARGGSTLDLPVSGPFHFEALAPVAAQLSDKMDAEGVTFREPTHRIISNIDGTVIPAGDHRRVLLDGIAVSVEWVKSQIAIWELGAMVLVPVDVAAATFPDGLNTLKGLAADTYDRHRPMQIVELGRAMHRNALRGGPVTLVGGHKITAYPPAQEVADRRLLRSSYAEAEIASRVIELAGTGDEKDLTTALLVVENPYYDGRDAGLRALRTTSAADHSLVTAKMAEWSTEWPGPIVRDLPRSPLPITSLKGKDGQPFDEATFGKICGDILAKLEASGLSPLYQGDFLGKLQAVGLAPEYDGDFRYFLETRSGGNPEVAEYVLGRLAYVADQNRKFLAMLKYGPKSDDAPQAQGIRTWEHVVLYVDSQLKQQAEKKGWAIELPPPGAMKMGDGE